MTLAPSTSLRHSPDVTTYAFDRTEPDTNFLARDVEALASELAAHPRGGARRAEPARAPGTGLVLFRTACRARRNADGMLLDAFDAASFIAQRCDWWDVSQIMAHPALARLAVGEAEQHIDAAVEAIPRPRWRRNAYRRALAPLLDERAELRRCATTLADVQDTGILDAF